MLVTAPVRPFANPRVRLADPGLAATPVAGRVLRRRNTAGRATALVTTLSCFVFVGCSGTRALRHPTSQETLEEIARATVDKPVKVEFAKPRRTDADPQITPAKGPGGAQSETVVREGAVESLGSGRLTLSKDGAVYAIPLEDVRRIEIKNAKLGARDGLFAGTLGGAIFGVIVGVGLSSGCHDKQGYSGSSSCPSVSKSALGFGAIGALLGAAAGAGVGAIAGHRTTLTF